MHNNVNFGKNREDLTPFGLQKPHIPASTSQPCTTNTSTAYSQLASTVVGLNNNNNHKAGVRKLPCLGGPPPPPRGFGRPLNNYGTDQCTVLSTWTRQLQMQCVLNA